MAKLDVKHFFDIYKMRKEMQDEGITNPSPEIKRFTKDFVEKLSRLPLNDEIILKDNSFFDSHDCLIIRKPAK